MIEDRLRHGLGLLHVLRPCAAPECLPGFIRKSGSNRFSDIEEYGLIVALQIDVKVQVAFLRTAGYDRAGQQGTRQVPWML